MALPTSGTISMGQIRNEVSDLTASNPISLNSLESGSYFPITRSPNKPNGTTPNGMGEWYGYQGGHIIDIETITWPGYVINDYGINYYPDDYSNDGYQYFTGTYNDSNGIDLSGTTMLYPDYPVWFYNNQTSYGAVYIYIGDPNLYIYWISIVDNNNNEVSYYVDRYFSYGDQWGYIYYRIPTGVTTPYFKIRIFIWPLST